jgi:hypothetical protein
LFSLLEKAQVKYREATTDADKEAAKQTYDELYSAIASIAAGLGTVTDAEFETLSKYSDI